MLITLIITLTVTTSLVTYYIIAHSLSNESQSLKSLASTKSASVTSVSTLRGILSNLTVLPSELWVYSRLDYPSIRFEEGLGRGDYQAYYVVTFRLGNHSRSFTLGVLKLPVIDLVTAYDLAISELPRVGREFSYDLVGAYFEGGEVVNGTLIKPPKWELSIALTYCGFRLWGSDYLVVINALNHTVVKVYPADYPSVPKGISCSYFRINYPKEVSRDSVINYAKYLVAHSNLSEVVKEVVKYGEVGELDLRLVKVFRGSKYLLTMKALKKGFMGRWFLAWVITFRKLPWRVSLLIDAVTGELINYVKGPLYPSMPYYAFEVRVGEPMKYLIVPTKVKLINGSVISTEARIKAVVVNGGDEGTLELIGEWVVNPKEAFRNFSSEVVMEYVKQLGRGAIKLIPTTEHVSTQARVGTEVVMKVKYVVNKEVSKGIHVTLIKLKVRAKEYGSWYSWYEVIPIPFLVK